MTEAHLENKDQFKATTPETTKEVALSDAQKDREDTVRSVEKVGAVLEKENPKAGEHFRTGVENLTGLKVQGGLVEVTIGDGRLKLDAAEKSLQAEIDTFLGGLEAGTKVVEGGTDTRVGVNVDLGPVGVRAQSTQDVEGNTTYTGSVQLPEGIRLWAERSKDGTVAGVQYEWQNDALGKGTFVLKRDEAGSLTIEGSLKTPTGTKIKVSSTDGETAEVNVSGAIAVGAGSLGLNAELGVQGLDRGLPGARLGDFGGDVSYTVRF